MNSHVKSTHMKPEELGALETVSAGLQNREAGSAGGWYAAEMGQPPTSGATPWRPPHSQADPHSINERLSGGGSAVRPHEGTRLGREYRQGWTFAGRVETRWPFPHGRLLVHHDLDHHRGISPGQAKCRQFSRPKRRVLPNKRAARYMLSAQPGASFGRARGCSSSTAANSTSNNILCRMRQPVSYVVSARRGGTRGSSCWRPCLDAFSA